MAKLRSTIFEVPNIQFPPDALRREIYPVPMSQSFHGSSFRNEEIPLGEINAKQEGEGGANLSFYRFMVTELR
jgi:hypothetical protein